MRHDFEVGNDKEMIRPRFQKEQLHPFTHIGSVSPNGNKQMLTNLDWMNEGSVRRMDAHWMVTCRRTTFKDIHEDNLSKGWSSRRL